MNLKLAGVLILAAMVFTGCDHPTKTHLNLEYVESIKTSKGELLQFKDNEGYKLNYFVDSGASFNLDKGKKYEVKVSVEDWAKYGDFIQSVKEER